MDSNLSDADSTLDEDIMSLNVFVGYGDSLTRIGIRGGRRAGASLGPGPPLTRKNFATLRLPTLSRSPKD